MKLSVRLKRVCNYVTWYNPVKRGVTHVTYHKTLTSSDRKRWARLPARLRVKLVYKYSQKKGHYTNEVRV